MNSIPTFPSQTNAQISQPRANQPSSVRFGMSGQDSFSSTQANQPSSGILGWIKDAASYVRQKLLSFIGNAAKYVTSKPAIPVSGINTESAEVEDNQTLTDRLNQAIQKGSLEEVNAVLNALPTDPAERSQIINQRNKHDNTPLHRAVYWGKLEIAQLLLEKGAQPSINIPTQRGKTPLHEAAELGKLEIAQLLLEKGDPESMNAPTSYAMETPLHLATKNGNPEIVKLLLAKGAKAFINQPDEEGQTPLHWVAERGSQEIAQLLLANGAKESVNLPDKYGKTPLHLAAGRGYLEIAQLLLANGAKESVNLTDKYGWTPLHHAAVSARPEVVQLLLEKGAQTSINAQTNSGTAPVMLVEESNSNSSYNTVGILLAHGAKPQALTDDFKQAVIAHLDTTRNQHTAALLNPQATHEEVKAATRWFQLFPPGGGELNWGPSTEQFNQFIRDQETELQSLTTTEEKHQVLDRLQPLLRVNVPVVIGKNLLDAAKDLRRKDWLADAVQVSGNFPVTQAYLHLASPLFNEREQAVKARNNKPTATNFDEVD